MLKRLIGGTVLAALVAAAPAHANSKPSVYPQPVPQVTYGGGPTQSSPIVYLVFWGPYWTAPAAQAEIAAEQATFRQIGSSGFMPQLAEYGITGYGYGGTYVDTSAPTGSSQECTPSGCQSEISRGDLEQEIPRAQAQLGSADPARAQYLIFPQPGSDLSGFGDECGEHAGGAGGYSYALLMPFADPTYSQQCLAAYSTDNGQRAPSEVAADTSIATHESFEIATDPWGTGWQGAGQDTELADLCAWYSDTPAGMTENVSYLWSAAHGDCEAPDPTPASAPARATPPAAHVAAKPHHHHRRHHRRRRHHHHRPLTRP